MGGSGGWGNPILGEKRILADRLASCCSSAVRGLVILAALVLVGCSAKPEALQIRQYHLRALKSDAAGVDSIRAENLKRFHGAVSTEDRLDRLGHYYTIKWHGPEGMEGEPVRLVFEYQQAATGSEVLRREIRAPAGKKGKTELQIIGPDYRKKGRVLAWRLSFYRGDHLVTTKQSYQWE